MSKQAFYVESIGHDIRSTQFAKGGCCDTLTANDFKDPTLVAYAIENHPCDSRITLTDDGIVQTLNARMGTGGNNTPMVLMAVGSSNSKAAIVTDNTFPTLMGIRGAHHDVPILCWAVDSHPMDSRVAIYEDACPTVTSKIVKAGSDGPLMLIRRKE